MQMYRRLMNQASVLMAAVLAATVAASCRKPASSASAPIPQVSVASVLQQDVPVFSEFVGTTVGFVNADIFPKVSGYLLRQDYHDGDAVRTGQLLFEIDPREYQAALEQTQGNLAQAEAQLKQNQLNLTRDTDLYKAGVMARQDFDNQTQSTHATAAQVEADEGALKAAKLNLEWTKVFSPINGVAAIATAQVGNLVSTTTLLTTVSQLDPIKVEFPITESFYLRIAEKINRDAAQRAKDSPKFQLVLADGSTYKHLGEVYDVNRQVDIQTGTIKVEAVFPNPDNILRPGLYAKVRAATDTAHAALLVPQDAILETQGQYQVAVVDSGNKVMMRTVTIGQQVGSLQIVQTGISAGEHVVTEGLQKVRDGMEVDPHVVAIQPPSEVVPGAAAAAPSAVAPPDKRS